MSNARSPLFSSPLFSMSDIRLGSGTPIQNTDKIRDLRIERRSSIRVVGCLHYFDWTPVIRWELVLVVWFDQEGADRAAGNHRYPSGQKIEIEVGHRTSNRRPSRHGDGRRKLKLDRGGKGYWNNIQSTMQWMQKNSMNKFVLCTRCCSKYSSLLLFSWSTIDGISCSCSSPRVRCFNLYLLVIQL